MAPAQINLKQNYTKTNYYEFFSKNSLRITKLTLVFFLATISLAVKVFGGCILLFYVLQNTSTIPRILQIHPT